MESSLAAPGVPRSTLGALFLLALLALPASPAPAFAAPQAPAGDALHAAAPALEIRRASGPIAVDGDLSDPAWQDAIPITTWYETRPGDNVEPRVSNVAYLTYDDQFFYAGFRFADPQPRQIRAPLGDRDNVPSYTDYGGVIVDPRNDGKTAQMFLANPRGIQYDAISSDASGEDSAPDFFWDAAGRITADGWELEIRIPFASLRYGDSDPEQWRIMLYRNWPREFRYQMFTSRLPRDSSCFICNTRPLVGLEGLPSGSHWVAAPYVNATQLQRPRGELGTPLESDDLQAEIGLDAKWVPDPDTVLDATVNPDFSQIESDVAQIAANERFALFFPEKRPFFLESVDLLSTPYQAVYTRTFTSPRWGARGTGEIGDGAYTVLVGEDRGGGSTILPGPHGSGLADQDFESTVAIARYRHDFGQSFLSALYSGREIEGGAYNRVAGPDFRWQPTSRDTVSGQLLFSRSETPHRPDLAAEWDGRRLSGHAAKLQWYRAAEPWGSFLLYEDLGDGFRADNGFVPEVGLRRALVDVGYTFRPEDKPISRLRTFLVARYAVDRDGELLDRLLRPGFGVDGLWSSSCGSRSPSTGWAPASRPSIANRCATGSKPARHGASRGCRYSASPARRSISPTTGSATGGAPSSAPTFAPPTTCSSPSTAPAAPWTSPPPRGAKGACSPPTSPACAPPTPSMPPPGCGWSGSGWRPSGIPPSIPSRCPGAAPASAARWYSPTSSTGSRCCT
ncbi:MAG TPA: DUF5916 domain-containing protein, partial [Thermoanaerobaculia bacterium]|nr:DUF5916 domain-containing protein [Thermoanaerobaculia bacterium]